MNANLYALFESHFPAGPERPCILVRNGPVVHYDELAAASGRVANALVRLGCKPGDRVAVQTDKVWQQVALYLGCLRAGLVYLPLNTAYQKAELTFFFGDARPRVIVCRPEMLGVIATLDREATVLTLDAHGGELLDRAQDEPDRFETVQSRPDDLAAILYTSGTTGRSKGAMLTHRNLASNAITLVEAWAFTGNDTLLHALPVFHVHGLFVALHCVLLSGARMLWLPRFDAKEVADLLPLATVMMGVPTFYTRLLGEATFTRERCANIRVFISGSAPLLPETFDAFRARTGHTILERYGMSETLMLVSNPYFGTPRERIGGTVGVPLPGVAVRVVDERGMRVPGGEIGQVQVRGPNVFGGYWRLPEKTAEEFTPDGFFRTGDVGHFGGPGRPANYLTLVGRSKDLIISGGYNVYPKEIEGYIDAMPGVIESAVIGLPHPDFGEAVAAVVVARQGEQVNADAVIARLKSQIANFKVPKRVWVVGELPRNAMGKVQKNLLREQHRDTFAMPRQGAA